MWMMKEIMIVLFFVCVCFHLGRWHIFHCRRSFSLTFWSLIRSVTWSVITFLISDQVTDLISDHIFDQWSGHKVCDQISDLITKSVIIFVIWSLIWSQSLWSYWIWKHMWSLIWSQEFMIRSLTWSVINLKIDHKICDHISLNWSLIWSQSLWSDHRKTT